MDDRRSSVNCFARCLAKQGITDPKDVTKQMLKGSLTGLRFKLTFSLDRVCLGHLQERTAVLLRRRLRLSAQDKYCRRRHSLGENQLHLRLKLQLPQ